MRLRASLRTKVLGISTLLLSLTLVVTLVARGAFAVVEHEVAELSAATSPATVKLLNIDRDAHQALLGFERAVRLAAGPECDTYVEEYRSNAEQLRTRWVDFEELAGAGTAEERAPRATFVRERDAWVKTCDGLLARGAEVSASELDSVRKGFQAMRDPLDRLEEEIFEARMAQHAAEVAAVSASSRDRLTWALAFAIGLGIAVTFAFARSIAGPINRLSHAAERIARGDVDVELPPTRGDEVGVLIDSFARLRDSMGRLGAAAEALASGHLDVRFDPRSAEDRLGHSFTTMLGNLREIVQSLQSAATSMEDSSAELGQLSSGLRVVADETANKATWVSASGEEMQSCINEIAQNASRVADVARQAVRLSSVTSTAMTEMKTSSEEISQVTELIANIAEQTNLLALNATIEAARAGEAGRGFAVVAGEVKTLAVETGSATSRITETVTAVQQRACEASDSITSVSQVIDEVDSIASTIASAVEEQSVTTQEIARNISDVACAAERTQRATEQAEHAARAVADLARDLRGIASRFHLAAAK